MSAKMCRIISVSIAILFFSSMVFAGTGQERERMDFNFKNADLHDMLSVIAKISKMNVVVDPGLKGSITCDFKQVPWDKGLKKMLEPIGVGMFINGNLLRVFKATGSQQWAMPD